MTWLPMCSARLRGDCWSDCRSVLIGDELDALDLGLDHAVDRVDARAADAHDAQDGLVTPAATRADHRLGLGGVGGLGGAPAVLEHVLRDVRGEDGAQALLGRRHALVAAPALLGLLPARLAARRRGGRPRSCAPPGCGAAAALDADRAAPEPCGSGTWRVACGAGPSLGSGRPAFGSCSGLRMSAPCGPSSSVLRKRAASGPSRMLARLPLSIPEPPPQADGRRTPPCRQGRT